MKAYFVTSHDIEGNKIYENLLRTALKSAKENTTLKLCALYDGKRTDNLYKIFLEYGVDVHIHQLSFLDKLKYFYDEKYIKDTGIDPRIERAATNFLKFDIPLYEKEDELILYSDIDVFFQNDADWDKLKTKTLSAAPEFSKEYDIIKGNRYFSAGIMIINVPELAKRRELLLNNLDNKIRPYQECNDQGFFNEFYKNDFDELPLEYNWKPYWGIEKKAKIVHIHGFKPGSFPGFDIASVMEKNADCIKGILYYFSVFYKTLNIDNSEYMCSLADELYTTKYSILLKKRLAFKNIIRISLYNLLKKHKNFFTAKFIESLEKKLLIKNLLSSEEMAYKNNTH